MNKYDGVNKAMVDQYAPRSGSPAPAPSDEREGTRRVIDPAKGTISRTVRVRIARWWDGLGT